MLASVGSLPSKEGEITIASLVETLINRNRVLNIEDEFITETPVCSVAVA